MELFATLNVRRVEDQRAIERAMASRDKRWLASLGLKGSRTSQLASSTAECDETELEQADPDAEMAALDEEMVGLALNTPAENERPAQLSMRLIRESLAQSKKPTRRVRAPEDEDKEIEAMLRKKILRLDWLDIAKIENLDAFTHVEELYLQYNLIETMEGLEDHDQLTFVALAGNRIREVKNLKHLHNLKFLDLSMNYIEDFDVSEFPNSLRVLRLAGNPFTRHMPAYARLFFERLPNLVQVDQFRRPSSTSSTEIAPLSASSSVESATSVSESHAAVLPLSALHSPMDQYRALQVEVELPQHEQDLLEKQEMFEAENNAAFNLTDYEKQRSDRMSKWKLQLTALTSRTREQLAESGESIKAGTSNRFRERRSLALSRARQATDAALVDAASHFKQMELAHQDWQQTQQRRPTPSQVS
ncbi:Leucine-rich repeat-containing protein 46 [Phytophthora pseudosyringae]|uniref:Leucine-rich repeat-containing protein 46 n=1 Tax=Phytophthora pseudosyringae TaxID=221518 RepID=A0A8T1W321_9STRA|nr:Leucine-rich repeat-containing protein 46 [Phytophthora pseudosyringae]